jgi:signal transduction histidine kinase
MLPESISNFALGPFIGLTANGIITVLCAIALALYRTYHPLRSLFLFYLSLSLCFLGWVIYGLQRSPQSILLGYRIEYGAMALLPACWIWFALSLFNEKPGRFLWAVTGASLMLSAFALFGEGPLSFAFPLKPDLTVPGILRPQSKLLRPAIQSFCMGMCLVYFLLVVKRLVRFKGRRPVYMICVAAGLLVWFLGGLHDGLRSSVAVFLAKEFVLWFASLWLSIFMTIAIILHFRSLEEAVQEELQGLNRVKSKALDHLAHELRTPLAVVRAKVQLLKRRLQTKNPPETGDHFFETLEKHLNRLLDIQQEAETILRSHQDLEEGYSPKRAGFPLDFSSASQKNIQVSSFIHKAVEQVKQKTRHRQIHFLVEVEKDLCVSAKPRILHEVLEGLLKNAIENTPDEGTVQITLEPVNGRAILRVQDFGVGITAENQKHLFDGFFHAEDTELYASRKPYDFNAGGKGLDLFRMKAYEKNLGYHLSVESRRCIHLSGNRDRCPGRISLCPHCRSAEDCFASGGSVFFVSLPVSGKERHEMI